MRKILFLSFIAVALITTGCSPKKDVFPMLYPVKVEGRYGYINAKGTLVVAPQYDAAGNFSEGLAWIRVNKREGYIDEKGRCVIKPRFMEATDFHEGLAAVKDGELWGYIDKKENLVIKPQFEQVKRFSDGRARVRVKREWGYIDKQGSIAIKPQFAMALDFSEGLAVVYSQGSWRYMDQQGTYILGPFKIAHSFSEGLAAVGNFQNQPDGTVTAQMQYINKEGKVQHENRPSFEWADIYTEGLALVRIADECGYIDREGRWAIRPSFESARPFAEGRACVRIDDHFGFIDKTGKIVIQPQFETYPAGFSGGLAFVPDEGYIDRSGKFIWRSTKEVEPEYVGQYTSISLDSCAELVVRMEGGKPAAFYRSWYCGKGAEPPDSEPLDNISIEGMVLTGTTPDGHQVTWDLGNSLRHPLSAVDDDQ